VDLAFRYDDRVLIEEGIDARELECAVLGNDDPKASIVGEVVPGREFYDYDDKYREDNAKLLIPAAIPEEVSQEVRRLAVEAFRVAGISGMARVDFFLERGTGRVLVNELNTLPGFTAISMYPKLWEASGLPLRRLLDELIRLAIERKEERDRLSHEPPAELA
jgi:D-alanine-D-alanine ligase